LKIKWTGMIKVDRLNFKKFVQYMYLTKSGVNAFQHMIQFKNHFNLDIFSLQDFSVQVTNTHREISGSGTSTEPWSLWRRTLPGSVATLIESHCSATVREQPVSAYICCLLDPTVRHLLSPRSYVVSHKINGTHMFNNIDSSRTTNFYSRNWFSFPNLK